MLFLVGVTGFEPATTRPQTRTLTGLSYTPLQLSFSIAVQRYSFLFNYTTFIHIFSLLSAFFATFAKNNRLEGC